MDPRVQYALAILGGIAAIFSICANTIKVGEFLAPRLAWLRRKFRRKAAGPLITGRTCFRINYRDQFDLDIVPALLKKI
jgi:hypothetical protein